MQQTLKAILSLRVSTDEQAENGTSLETQELTCLRKAAEMGAQVVHIYRDEGVSGAFYLSREGIQAALADIEAGKANLLIVYSISRLSRDVEHLQIIKKRIERAGAKLVICDMPLEDTEEGELMFGISGAFAQYERQVIRKRTMKGRRRRAEEGQQPYRALSPYGYHVVTKQDVLTGQYPPGMVGTYHVIEDEARHVREIFRLYAAGISIYGLMKHLADAGIKPRPKAYETTGRWYGGALRFILKNPLYKGRGYVGTTVRMTDENRLAKGRKSAAYLVERPEAERIPIAAPAIVEESVWEACQLRLEDNKVRMSGKPSRRYTLSGLMRCPRCRQRMGANRRANGSLYFLCTTCGRYGNSSEKQKTGKPASVMFRSDFAEAALVNALTTIAKEPSLLENVLIAYTENPEAAQQDEMRDRLVSELNALKAREKAAVNAQIAGIQAGADPSVYASVFAEIAASRKDLQARLAILEPQTPEVAFDPKDTAAIMAQALADVEMMITTTSPKVTPIDKNQALSAVIHAIHPLEDDSYEIEMLPLPSSSLTVQCVLLYCSRW